ncbi:hypothetical protein LXA47_23625 [Massilia sp. P8910]|uniref:hypothetical protein n=1 Tax=Massilia antarctica TaxID=2765360 RepID=UPI001E2BEBC0|nr:hypothetical protein [Massilia antarctica]MCE3606570.1 hypothetical protein [Massilia antarctica]
MPDQKPKNSLRGIIMAVVALPVVPFIAWQIYCQVVYVTHFEKRCGEALNVLKASGQDFKVGPTVVNQRIDAWDRQFGFMAYEYANGAGAGNFYCEVNTIRSFLDLKPITVWEAK